MAVHFGGPSTAQAWSCLSLVRWCWSCLHPHCTVLPPPSQCWRREEEVRRRRVVGHQSPREAERLGDADFVSASLAVARVFGNSSGPTRSSPPWQAARPALLWLASHWLLAAMRLLRVSQRQVPRECCCCSNCRPFGKSQVIQSRGWREAGSSDM